MERGGSQSSLVKKFELKVLYNRLLKGILGSGDKTDGVRLTEKCFVQEGIKEQERILEEY